VSAAIPLAQQGLEILANLLKIGASPQGLELLARMLGPSAADIHAAAQNVQPTAPAKVSDSPETIAEGDNGDSG
jgi:hypothetical protein